MTVLCNKTQTGGQEKKRVLEESNFILGVHQNQVKKTRQRPPDLSEAGFRNVRKSSRCHSTASSSNREEGSVMLWRSQKITLSLASDLGKENKEDTCEGVVFLSSLRAFAVAV